MKGYTEEESRKGRTDKVVARRGMVVSYSGTLVSRPGRGLGMRLVLWLLGLHDYTQPPYATSIVFGAHLGSNFSNSLVKDIKIKGFSLQLLVVF